MSDIPVDIFSEPEARAYPKANAEGQRIRKAEPYSASKDQHITGFVGGQKTGHSIKACEEKKKCGAEKAKHCVEEIQKEYVQLDMQMNLRDKKIETK